jgi:putative sugar O-methyltransferase
MKLYVRKVLRLFPAQLRLSSSNLLKNFIDCFEDETINDLIKSSILALNSGDYEEAERRLLQAAMLNPTDLKIPPHLTRIRFLKSRSTDDTVKMQTQNMLETINSMNKEIKSNQIYVPGDFWETLGKIHLQLLERYGIENFKRTISHNYQNWLMVSLDDPQVRQLFRTWPEHFTSEPWFNIIETPDHVGYHLERNPSMVFEEPTYMLAFAENREIYRISVGLLWEYVKRNDSFNILEKLTESEIGNPIRIWRKGQLISSDLAHSVRERNMLLESLSLNGNEGFIVGELGAGHGRLAEIFGRTTNFRYFIFDITPALFVSQWYIKKLFPDEKIFEFRHFDDFAKIQNELHESRFAFFTSNQIEKFPNDYFNLFINMNSLGEMRPDQIQNFLRQINRLTSVAFLSRQELKAKSSSPHLFPLTKDDFCMPDRWRLIVDKVDEFHPFFFNQIWKR